MGKAKRLAAAWIEFTAADLKSPVRDYSVGLGDDPQIRLKDLIYRDPERAWKVTVEISKMAKSEEIFDVLAFGPLEDALSITGPETLEELQGVLAENPQFRTALLWVNPDVLHPVIERWICSLRSGPPA